MTLPKAPRPSGGSGNAGSGKFTEQFNRLVGNRTGRPVRARPKSTKAIRQRRQQTLKKGRRTRGTAISLGTSKLPKAVEKSRARWFGELGQPDTGIGFERNLRSNLEDVYDDLSSKLIRYENEAQQVQQEYIASTTGVNSADPMEQWNAEHPGEKPMQLAAPLTETWAGTPVGKALDYMSRPAYALNEGMRNVLEEGYRKENEGKSSWDTFASGWGDLASGAWEGLSGKKQTGSGEVYEIYKNQSKMPFGSALRSLEEEHPFIEEQVSRGFGLAGEATLDPTDWVGLGSANIVRDTKKIANEVTMGEAVGAAGAKAGEEFYDNVVATRYPHRINNPNTFIPDRDAFVTHGEVEALDALTKSELSIHGGGQRGRYQVQNGAGWAHDVSNVVAESQRELLFRSFNTHVGNFRNFVMSGKRMKTAAVEAYRVVDDDFDRLLDDLHTELVNRGRIDPAASLDELLDAVGKQDKNRITKLADNIRNELDGDLQKVRNDVYEGARNATYRTMGIRVGKKVIPVRATGRAYNAIAQKLRTQSDEVSEMSYEKMMPALLSLKAQKARSVGVEAFKKFQKEVSDMARRYTKDEADQIHRAIENNLDLTSSPHLQEGKEFVQAAYKDLWDREVAAGARPDADSLTMGGQYLKDYVYVYNQKGHLTARKTFKNGRKEAVHNSRKDPNGTNRGRFSTEEAAREGLKPVTNAFHALGYRRLKHQRDMTRAIYGADMVESFGFWAENLSTTAKENRKVTKISVDQLPNHMRQEIKDKGGAYYLPFHHADIVAKNNELLSWNSAQMGKWMREWNKFIGIYKASMTIPAPGFHINNMIGDAFMGMMDGVKAREYGEVLRKAGLARQGKTVYYEIAPGVKYTHQELWSMYQADAAGGYFRVDQAGNVKSSVKGAPGQAVRKVGDKALELAELREDFGRFTHYLHALREETSSRISKNMTSKKALDQAREAALWRVNYYKFDYNALTMWERKLKTLGIPFYTYTRKVIPVLLSSMYQNPKYINMLNRYFTYNDGSAADDFSNWNVPGYLRMGGAAFMNDGEEPWTLAMGGTPLGKLNMLQGGEAGTWDPRDPDFTRGWAKELTTQLNPVAQLPFELSMGRENFTSDILNRGEEGNFLLNKLPMMKDILSEGNQIPGLQKLIPDINTEEEPWDWRSLIYNRMTGAGIQAKPLSRGVQAQAHEDWMDQLIEDPMFKVNNSQDLYKIVPNNQPDQSTISYRVLSNLESGEDGQPAIVREFNTAQEAMSWVKKNIPKGYENPDEFLEWGPQGQARYVNESPWRVQP